MTIQSSTLNQNEFGSGLPRTDFQSGAGAKIRKVLIYDPYLDTLGGGERYCLTVAEYLLKNGWKVNLLWDDKKIIEKAIERFDLRIESVETQNFASLQRKSLFQRFLFFHKYDLVFWLSDGSVPFLFGRKNILHIQRPFINISGRDLLNQIKLKFIYKIVCNSGFTKKYVDREYGVNSVVLYPPAEIIKANLDKKENIILAVGRFEESFQAKRQDILVEAFKNMVNKGLKNWQFVLLGGSLGDPDKNKFLLRLKKVEGYPIKFLVNASHSKLAEMYVKAKIFWHAAGYGVDERKEPWKTEHFGIAPVEAMSAGDVPIVFDAGGLKEIVRRGEGERWQTINGLISKTFALINDESKYKKMQEKSIIRAKNFSKEKFCESLMRLIK